MRQTTEDLCRVLHYALQDHGRVFHKHFDLDIDTTEGWDEAPEDYKAAIRRAVGAIETVTRKDEREAFRGEIIGCLDDLRMNRGVPDAF